MTKLDYSLEDIGADEVNGDFELKNKLTLINYARTFLWLAKVFIEFKKTYVTTSELDRQVLKKDRSYAYQILCFFEAVGVLQRIPSRQRKVMFAHKDLSVFNHHMKLAKQTLKAKGFLKVKKVAKNKK